MTHQPTTSQLPATQTTSMQVQDPDGQIHGHMRALTPKNIKTLNEICDYFDGIVASYKSHRSKEDHIERSCNATLRSTAMAISNGIGIPAGVQPSAVERRWAATQPLRRYPYHASPSKTPEEWQLALEMMAVVMREVLKEIGLEDKDLEWQHTPTRDLVQRMSLMIDVLEGKSGDACNLWPTLTFRR